MAEKTCSFCGEPIAGGLQEHDFATCAYNLRDKVVKLEAELLRIANATEQGIAKAWKRVNKLEAENERLREREDKYCCIHKWLAENWPESPRR